MTLSLGNSSVTTTAIKYVVKYVCNQLGHNHKYLLHVSNMQQKECSEHMEQECHCKKICNHQNERGDLV